MTQTKLQLNGEVTDAWLLGTRQKLFHICANALQLGNIWRQSHSLTLSKALAFSSTALSMENFISQTSKSCYYQLRRISSVQKYLSIKASVKLVTSLILSRLDYCNFHLSGLPASSVHTFVASRTVLLASSFIFALESIWCVLFSHFTGQKVLSIITISATKMNKRM